MTEKTCKTCIHFDACSKWTDFPSQCGVPVCAKFKEQSEWISVDERLPTYKDGKVLIYTAYGISVAQKTTTNHWKGDNAIPKQITHWMPLPEPPITDKPTQEQ